MARGQGKDKNTTYFNIAMLTDGLEASVKRVMSLFSKMVRGVNASLSKLGQINNSSFKMQSSSARYGSSGSRSLKDDRQISATFGRDTRSVGEFYREEIKNRDDLIKEYEDTLETYNKELSSITITKKDGTTGRAKAGFGNRKKELSADIKQVKELIDLAKKEYTAREDRFLLSRPYNRTQIYDTGAKKGTKQTQSESWGTGIKGMTARGKEVELMAGKDVILETYHDIKKNIDVVKQKTIEWQDIETSIGIQRVKTNEIITDNIEEQEKKQSGFFGTLFKRFKSVAIYRGIRTILKEVAASFTETFDGIAQVSSEFKDTMSSVTSSLNMLKATGGVAVYNLLVMAEPLIKIVTQLVTSLANAISFLTAELRGASEYVRINLDYMKEYQTTVSGTLLSFDAFTTLGSSGNGIDWQKMLDEVPVGEITQLEKSVARVAEILTSVALISAVSKIGDLLKNWKTDVSEFKLVLGGISLLFIGIKDTITNWSEMSGFQRFVSLFTALAAAAVTFSIAWHSTHNWVKAASIAAMAAGGGLMVANMIQGFEAGGSYARGDIFRANEFGKTELVASSSSGGAVMNMQQLESAVHNGVASAMSANGGGDAVIELDGNKVGRYIAGNAGFRATANKRNTGLNWR